MSAATGYSEYEDQEQEYLATFREDVRRIREFVPSGRILEVGCGYGYFLQCALDAGFDAYGIDLSPAAVKWAATRHPGRVFCGLLEEVPEIQDQKYDVIFGSHLIEHLTEPSEFLREAGRLLRPGGLVVMVTPNIKSLLARVSGSRWVSFKIPEHVSYYDPATITTLLNRTGYTVRAVDSAYQYYALPFVSTPRPGAPPPGLPTRPAGGTPPLPPRPQDPRHQWLHASPGRLQRRLTRDRRRGHVFTG